MIEASWFLFVVASLVLIATPGQDMMIVMSRSIAQGPLAGIATAAGVSVGLVGHTVLATLGLGALLRTSEWLFTALKLVGAAYLLYLGLTMIFAKHDALADRGVAPKLARLQLRGRMNARFGVFQDKIFRTVHAGDLRPSDWSRKRDQSSVSCCQPYFGLPLVHTTFWP